MAHSTGLVAAVLSLLLAFAVIAVPVLVGDEVPESVEGIAVEPTSTSVTVESTTAPPADTCAPEELLAAVGGQIDGVAMEITDRVCDNERAIATVRAPANALPEYQAESLFVVFVSGEDEWEVVRVSRSIDCAELRQSVDPGFSDRFCQL